MGRKLNLTITLWIFALSNLFSQTTISGFVSSENNLPLASANVILKDSLNSSILTYTYTNEKGEYVLNTNKVGAFNLIVSSMGFERKTLPLEIKKNQKEVNLNVVLKEQPMSLNEIIIQTKKPISIKKDTISFKTKYFTDGTEQTVEDLLQKIPGLQIDAQGAIKVGNQEIEKLMVDGDDLF